MIILPRKALQSVADFNWLNGLLHRAGKLLTALAMKERVNLVPSLL